MAVMTRTTVPTRQRTENTPGRYRILLITVASGCLPLEISANELTLPRNHQYVRGGGNTCALRGTKSVVTGAKAVDEPAGRGLEAYPGATGIPGPGVRLTTGRCW